MKKRRRSLLDDPIFEGEEFFFPPPDASARSECPEFSKEAFKKAAQEILKDGSAVISRDIISKGRKNWRRRYKGME